MKKLFRLTAVFIFLMNYSPVFGWGKTGHRVVAEIAEQNLTKRAKRQIHKITGKQSLAYFANHPDFIKSDPDLYKKTSSWHYVNFLPGMNKNDFNLSLKESSDQNLYKRMLILTNDLNNRKNLSPEQVLESLYFLVHLMGDAHQPLHLGREEDLGGNKIEVKWFGNNTNLHSLWDDKLVDFQKYSYTEYAGILDYRDKKFKSKMTSGNLEDWLYETYLKADFIYSGVNNGDKLRFRYDYDHVEILESQLLKAGLRLAKVLNEIFG